MVFVSYLNGAMDQSEANVVKTIDRFIDKYDLLEFGFCNDTLRRMYYREKKKNKLVSRYQVKKTKKGINV